MNKAVETAKANKANVYYYLKYILDYMPHHVEDTDISFLNTMMPWSAEYKEKRELIHPEQNPRLRLRYPIQNHRRQGKEEFPEPHQKVLHKTI